MTLDEFDKSKWHAGMKARYHGDGQTYPVFSVDFVERLVGLKGVQANAGETFWARCENVTIIKNHANEP